MAAGQLSLTRRALLAGACATPLAGGGGDRVAGRVREASDGDGRWGSALRRLSEAQALMIQADDTQDERLYDRLGARRDAALKALLRTPAPHLAALALKLDLLIAEQAWEITGGELCLAALQRDAHRFARG
jgi:hypothetical protein